jgi:hypothetical protein
MKSDRRNIIPLAVASLMATSLLAYAELSNASGQSVFGGQGEPLILAQTQSKDNRDDRQDDRGEDQGDRQDDRGEDQDCRQDEGVVGEDKRDCKQE